MRIAIPNIQKDTIEYQYPESALNEAENLLLRDELFENRTEVEGLTIDDITTLDVDDAIWAEVINGKYVLSISIADVTSLVEESSSIDKEALRRVYTRYLSKGNIPMIPHLLSENRCSLLEGQRRPTITIQVTLNDSFNIENIDLKETFITSKKKMYHRQAATILSDPEAPYNNVLTLCNHIANNLFKKRASKGSIAFHDLESGMYTDEEGHIHFMKNDERHCTHLIIQEFMILANEAIATELSNENYPMLYRNFKSTISEDTRKELVDMFRNSIHDFPKDIDIYRDKISHLVKRALYSPERFEHDNLKVEGYTHGTSPIRRYIDIIIHRIIRSFIQEEKPPYTKEELFSLARYLNMRKAQIREAQDEYYRKKAYERTATLALNGNYQEISELHITDIRKIIQYVAQHNCLNESIYNILHHKIDNDELRDIEIYEIIFHKNGSCEMWESLKEKAKEKILEDEEIAISLLSVVTQMNDEWTDMFIETQKTDQDYLARVRIITTNGTIQTPGYSKGGCSKTAKRKAARIFWEYYFGG